jgi:hypothetical protein
MILSTDQIKANIAWLLSNGSPPIKYLTHIHLLRTPPYSEEIMALWQQVETSKETEEIFSKQEKNGSWYAGGSWALKPSYMPKDGWDPYNPKYVTAVWILPLLGEMGFTVRDRRIQKACDYVLSNGYFRHPIFLGSAETDFSEIDISPCRFAQYLIALGMVGLANDRRARIGYEYLLQKQREDGGWALEQHFRERNWTRSCPFSSYHATMALYHSGEEAYKGALIKALEFLVWHLSTKDTDEIRRFFYHGHNTVHELLMFSELRVGLQEKAVQTILEWLMNMYRANEGCFRYISKPISKYSLQRDGIDARVAKYRLHHIIEDDWLTYYLTRIGINLNQQISILSTAING